MDPKAKTRLLKARKGATAGFGPKDWEEVLSACGFDVMRSPNVFVATDKKTGAAFSETKRQGYRVVTFYNLTRGLRAAGFDLEVLASAALGLPTLKEEAEAKKQAAIKESGRGTCQCCFGGFKSRDNVKLVLHGYERPGHGYVIGRCMGEGHPPFEVSCEQTKAFRERFNSIKADAIAWKGRLERDEVPLLSYVNKRREGDFLTGKRVDAVVAVKRGESRAKQEGLLYETPSFEELAKMELSQVESKIQHVSRDIAFLTGKLETWVPVEWPAQQSQR